MADRTVDAQAGDVTVPGAAAREQGGCHRGDQSVRGSRTGSTIFRPETSGCVFVRTRLPNAQVRCLRSRVEPAREQVDACRWRGKAADLGPAPAEVHPV